MASQISKKFKLTFVLEDEVNGNVCFANNPELRTEYKTSFTATNVKDCVYAIYNSKKFKDKNLQESDVAVKNMTFLKNADTFWQLVLLGKKIREQGISDSILSAINNINRE